MDRHDWLEEGHDLRLCRWCGLAQRVVGRAPDGPDGLAWAPDLACTAAAAAAGPAPASLGGRVRALLGRRLRHAASPADGAAAGPG